MSEQGWRNFLAAKDIPDWSVLHGGAATFFRVNSLTEAVRLADAIARIPGVSSSGVLLTLSNRAVSLRLTRDVWELEVEHIDLARSISAVAHSHGAKADRSCIQEVQVAIAAKTDMLDVGFWRAVLGYSPMAEDNAIDPLGHGSTVWMQTIGETKTLAHAMHIDVSVPGDQVQVRLDAAIAAGGRIVDDKHAPSHWTLADRAGNRVCICGWPDGAAQTLE